MLIDTETTTGIESKQPERQPAPPSRVRQGPWPRPVVAALLIAILLLGAALRFTGIDWDEGQHLHPDERFVTMVENGLGWPTSPSEYLDSSRNPLNPYNHNQPNYVYGLFPVIVAKAVGQLSGHTGYSGVYLAGRVLSGVYDLLAVTVVFFLGRRLYSDRVGLMASLLLALAVLNIQQSHFFTVDSPTTFFATLCLYLAVRVAQGAGWRSMVALGVSFGLALASKVSIATFGLVIGLALILRAFRSDMGGSASAHESSLRTRAARLGRWDLHLAVDAGTPPANIRRLDALTLRWLSVAGWMALVLFVAFWTFRLAMPQAFLGPGLLGIKLNPLWVDNMLAISRISSGALDYPPSHQWANRPLSYVFTNMVLWGLGLPLGVTVWAGWAGMLWQLVRQKRVSHLLPWVWMTLTFVYHSTQFVKPVRYLLPIYPTMALIAGWCLVRMWERAQRCRRVEIRSLASALLGIVVLGTALWAFAFTGIYTRPVTRIEASRWMYENIPAGSRVTYEYWDDALPLNVDGKLGSEIFEGVRTEPYWEDIPEKREKLYQWLEQADYIVFSSNRLYGSIPRLRTRFPMTTRYYEAVFSGELGFELIQTFTSRPQLLGIEITDDNADESFTVYDHPRVSIFRKRADFDIQKAHALFDPIDLEHVVQIRPKQVATAPNELMLSPEALRTQRQGGTWSELFHRDGLTNRLPVPVWCLLITLLGWASFGLVWPALVRMPDSGLGLARTLGTLLFGYLSWLAASTDLLPFERSSLALILVAIVGAGAAAAWFRRGDLLRLLRERWRWLVASEVLFSVAFLAMLAVRWANPDLWHPAMGGEKPMDFAYLNAIIKSTTFPPYDPWYSGGYLNYYYFGWVPIAALIKFTGIIPAKGYNLALATLFACLLSGAASVTATLVRGEPQEHGQWLPRRLRWGILGGLLVTVAGNLGEVELLWRGLVEAGRRVADPGALGQLGDALRGAGALLKGQTTLAFRPEWWYWNASRMMSHGEINEFPFFSYLYADLHAHVMAMPILVLVIGLACVLALAHNPQRRSEARLQMNGWGTHATQILLLSLGLGASWCANAWDLPTGLALAAVALALGSRARNEAWNTAALARVGLQILCVAVLARVLYAPFHAHYGTAYTSVALWKGERSAPGDLIGIYLPFLFVLVTYLAGTGGKALARTPWWRALALRLEVGHRHTRAWHLRRALVHYPSILYGLVWVAIGVAGLVLLVLMLEGESYSAALAILLVMVAAGLLRSRLGTQEQLILLFIGAGLALTLGVEWVVLQGDIGRMNTVFKFSLQVWILWGMASAAALSWMLPSNPSARQGVVQRRWWRTALVLLAVGMFSYPLLATPAKMNDRMAQEAPHGLDGSAYMDLATYHDRDRELDLGHDAAAIRWLQEHVAGSPVIVEANTPLYRWGGRVSVNTGLPSVIGWDWHQKQQRAALSSQTIDWRLADLNLLYSALETSTAERILQRYQVGLVYVGELERAYYPIEGLAKFDAMVGNQLELIYQEGPVSIYRVLGAGTRLVETERGPFTLAGWWQGLRDLWIPASVSAQGPVALPAQAAGEDLLLDVPIEELESTSARGWNRLADRSALGAVLSWWAVTGLLGLAVWPLVAQIAPDWPDRGYLLARAIGLVLVGYLAWIGASLRWLANTPVSLWLLLLLVMVGCAAIFRQGTPFRSPDVQRHALGVEASFVALFLAWTGVRLLNPDLWQPWFGGEKMMEIAMLNAVSRSRYMPPYDPYFAGGILNYYYYGLYLVSLIGKLAGTSPEVSFNLAVPALYAMTLTHAWALGSRILGSGKLRTWQGLTAAALVGVLGNLTGGSQLLQQIVATGCQQSPQGLVHGAQCAAKGVGTLLASQGPALTLDYWYASTRVIPHTINEFPFFTFLFADLHPHLIAMPFGLLVLLLCGLLVGRLRGRAGRRWQKGPVASLGLVWVLALGMLGITNTWDLPLYVILTVATLLHAGYRWGQWRGVLGAAGVAFLIVAGALLAYSPFYAHFRAQGLSLALVAPAERSDTGPFLQIWGLLFWVLLGAAGWRPRIGRAWRMFVRTSHPLPLSTVGVLGGTWLAVSSGTIWPLLVILLVAAIALWFSAGPQDQVWLGGLMVVLAIGILLGIEWLYVADFLRDTDWRRMNTVFKFSLQAWLLLGISLGSQIPLLWRALRKRRGLAGPVWCTGLVLLTAAALVYPLMALPVRVQERFPSGSPARTTLDGTAYMTQAVYLPPEGSMDVAMRYDRQALEWMWQNVKGLQVLAEAPVGYYREGGLRISSYTGLPTLVGSHQYEQRPAAQVAPRQGQAELLFNSPDPQVALEVLQKNSVRLVYVGPLERALYPATSLNKFETLAGEGVLERIYANEQVTLYRTDLESMTNSEDRS